MSRAARIFDCPINRCDWAICPRYRFHWATSRFSVKQWLIKEGYEPLYGARPMRRAIQRAIGDPLSDELIRGRFKESRKVKVVLRDGAPAFIEQEAMAGV